MKVLVVLAAVIAVALGVTSYGQEPDKRCYHVGQYLRDGYAKCTFLRCTYGSEPWYDQYGRIQLFAERQHCAGGTEVSAYFSGYDNPCTERSYDCQPKVSYHPQPHYEPEPTYEKKDYGYEPKKDYGYEPKKDYGYEPKKDYGYEPKKDYGYEPKKDYGYEQKKDYGYEQKKDYGYEQKKDYGYEQKKDYGYEQKKSYGHQVEKKTDYGYKQEGAHAVETKTYSKNDYSAPKSKVTYEKKEYSTVVKH